MAARGGDRLADATSGRRRLRSNGGQPNWTFGGIRVTSPLPARILEFLGGAVSHAAGKRISSPRRVTWASLLTSPAGAQFVGPLCVVPLLPTSLAKVARALVYRELCRISRYRSPQRCTNIVAHDSDFSARAVEKGALGNGLVIDRDRVTRAPRCFTRAQVGQNGILDRRRAG